MNKNLIEDLIAYKEINRKNKFQTIFNFSVLNVAFITILVYFFGISSKIIIEDSIKFIATVLLTYLSCNTIALIGIYNNRKKYKQYFKENYNIDIFKCDLSKEKMGKLKKELNQNQKNEISKNKNISKKNGETEEKVNNKFKFKGYENHDIINNNKKLLLKKDETNGKNNYIK